ncbi:gliding motility lipoprotein GldH [Winogradskyella aquimaris]|uniref:Gliding motility lipoprotein GldH n=1 Tax=Winogradskyella aquimaris TaxID=864074 RepID=A0ABU5ELJ7_9FLAO|nr:gliding motility lipoprotein GldH [Winogradskyella aquimaris]MDY2586428.1 gliding motility lipoprotein GldH [Winogradskyella aquimaris]
MQKRINTPLLAFVSLFLAISCDSTVVYDEYKSVPNKWHKDSVATFAFKAPDTISNYNLYVNLRNTNDYAFSNLFLIVEMNYPNGKAVTDTLEYKMAAPTGELLGSGFTDIKENKLWYRGYKSQFKFTENGDYNVNIQHAMRKNGEVNGIDNLEGITDIGFRVERVQ